MGKQTGIQTGDRVAAAGEVPYEVLTGVVKGALQTPVGGMRRVQLDNGFDCGVRDKNLRKVGK